MHMADALVSTPVALTAGVAAVTLLAVAGREIRRNRRDNLVPLMGVTGAFIFAAQMINFSIPGTGSSGHIVGGVLLAAMLGPWAGFLVLASVLIIQCLIFADGGLMALGCNIINMGAMTALVAYPLIFKPLMRPGAGVWRIFGTSVLACTVGLELGACLVTAETELSGVTALPAVPFLGLMTSIHLAIGVGEGVATGAVLWFVARSRPELLWPESAGYGPRGRRTPIGRIILAFGAAAAVLGGIIAFFASSDPDGLEWSISRLTGSPDLPEATSGLAAAAGHAREVTAVMPDYEFALSGILGALMVVAVVWAICSLLGHRRRVRRPAR